VSLPKAESYFVGKESRPQLRMMVMTGETITPDEKMQFAILDMEIRAMQDFQLSIDRRDIDTAINQILGCTGTIFSTGAGTSSAVARRFAHLLTCCGTHSIYLDSAQAMHGYSAILRELDLLVAFSRGGETEEVNYVMALANEKGIPRIGILENTNSQMVNLCSHVVFASVNPENDAYGVIPFSSTLVQMAAGDMLCAGILARRGYSQSEFATFHPGGAVGNRLDESNR
jgi:arabinose-5-phosphate isomerase